MKEVTMYTTVTCTFCHAAERMLGMLGVPVKKIDVTDDQPMREKLVELTGQRTVPQIFVGEESIGGYSDLKALHARGEFLPKLDVPE
ncbi:MAG: glutaredoxin [Archangium sp.]|nr:glutaredoxin [Archangium sp.]